MSLTREQAQALVAWVEAAIAEAISQAASHPDLETDQAIENQARINLAESLGLFEFSLH